MKQLKDNGIKELIRLTKNELKNKANINHNHDNAYSKLNHTHSNYSLTTHNHDSVYSKLNHIHSYAASSHNHDDRYYTESEMDTKLNNKQDKVKLNMYQRIAKYTDYMNKTLEFIHLNPIEQGAKGNTYKLDSSTNKHLIFMALFKSSNKDSLVKMYIIDSTTGSCKYNNIINATDNTNFFNPGSYCNFNSDDNRFTYSFDNDVYGFFLTFNF